MTPWLLESIHLKVGPGGIDVWYIDESTDTDYFAMSAISVPFLRTVDGTWTLVWEGQYANLRDLRRDLRRQHGIPVKKELKASKLVAGRGRYANGAHQLSALAGANAVRWTLSNIGFLQPRSIISVCAKRTTNLYGHTRLEATLFALLQRMRTATEKNGRNAFVFFDEGHGEYRKIYRRARIFLPTGSALGGWSAGKVRNLPLTSFTKDANFKQSEHCFFTQLADLLSFSVLAKIRHENGTLPAAQVPLGTHTLYDAIPAHVLNLQASTSDPLRGIVRL